MRAPLVLPALLAATALSGCGQHGSYVKSDDTALGRVVVYRNGVAYYERKARAEADHVTLAVPQDKVDDFLKSLTVADARTGDAVPVSYPTAGATRGDVVDMTIQIPRGASRDLVVTYITDAPAWKPSYRVVVGPDDSVKVQGWAIVDNTSGEDWQQVKVGVGASSALSFRYDLRSVVHVHRETLGGQRAFVAAPPAGGAVHDAKKDEGLLLALGDAQIPLPAGHPAAGEAIMLDSEDDAGADVAERATASRGPRAAPARTAKPAVRKAPASVEDSRLQGLANRLRGSKEVVEVEGYASADGQRGLDAAHRVRNRLVQLGVAPDRVQVSDRGHVPGKAGVELKLVRGEDPTDDGQPVGESHFESASPMSVARGTSAMVAVLDKDTAGEVVYVYDPDAERGNAKYAFRAVRFTNPTESTLEAGPVTVYGSKRFIGEGITQNIPPRSTALVPFALDRQVKVSRTHEDHDRIARMLEVRRGIFTAEVRHTRATQFEVHNRGHAPATVFLRYALPAGWTLGEAPKTYEVQGETQLFAVDLAAGQSKTVKIEAWTPLTRTVDLRSPVGVDLMQAWLDTRPDDSTFVGAVRQILGVHGEMANHHARIGSLRSRMGELRTRKAELTASVERLEDTRAGESLRRTLVNKLREMEGRLQKATLEVVELQEALMLTRIRFQDAVAELTLERPTVASR